jgi:hypothetical protein
MVLYILQGLDDMVVSSTPSWCIFVLLRLAQMSVGYVNRIYIEPMKMDYIEKVQA